MLNHVIAEEEGIRTPEPTKGQDLKSCAFDQALLPPHDAIERVVSSFLNLFELISYGGSLSYIVIRFLNQKIP